MNVPWGQHTSVPPGSCTGSSPNSKLLTQTLSELCGCWRTLNNAIDFELCQPPGTLVSSEWWALVFSYSAPYSAICLGLGPSVACERPEQGKRCRVSSNLFFQRLTVWMGPGLPPQRWLLLPRMLYALIILLGNTCWFLFTLWVLYPLPWSLRMFMLYKIAQQEGNPGKGKPSEMKLRISFRCK